jgi:hypothetical protein
MARRRVRRKKTESELPEKNLPYAPLPLRAPPLCNPLLDILRGADFLTNSTSGGFVLRKLVDETLGDQGNTKRTFVSGLLNH